jgi:hypothetical protein
MFPDQRQAEPYVRVSVPPTTVVRSLIPLTPQWPERAGEVGRIETSAVVVHRDLGVAGDPPGDLAFADLVRGNAEGA